MCMRETPKLRLSDVETEQYLWKFNNKLGRNNILLLKDVRG